MQHFKRLSSAIDTVALLNEIGSVENAWDIATGRQEKIAVQREALAIPIRGLCKSAIGEKARRDVMESRWTTSSAKFPEVRALIEHWARQTCSQPGRAKIVCLPARRRVYPHIDRGAYYRQHDRYHAVLKSAQGSWLKAGDEEVRMREGELWWFDNQQVHEAFNDGDEDRIHIIFDMLPEQQMAETSTNSAMEVA
jgi:Aspartyl/Asparaginyl beta-hydroxylase